MPVTSAWKKQHKGQHSALTVAERTRHVVSDHASVSFAEAGPDAILGSDLGLDSLGFVEVVLALEREFRVRLDEERCDVAWVGDVDPDGPGAQAGSGTVSLLIALVEAAIGEKTKRKGAA